MPESTRSNEADNAADESLGEDIPAELEDYEEELKLIRVDGEEGGNGPRRRASRQAAAVRPPRVGRRLGSSEDWVNDAFVDFMSKRKGPGTEPPVPAS